MSIREQVDDATFLAQNGRHLGALTILMLAIAASAKRRFPRGTKSLEIPANEMGDREAFTLFLGGRIREILLGEYLGPDYGGSGISVNFRGQQHEVAYILYKFYRCELVHEGELPGDVEFSLSREPHATGLSRANRGVSISGGDRMVLGDGWIDLLIEALVQAPCNGPEFGIKHYKLQPAPNVDADTFLNSTIAKYGTTRGRFYILRSAVRLISPKAITEGADREVADFFDQLVASGAINGGAITGLRFHGFTDRAGRLQPRGLEMIREIAAAYEMVEV